VNPSWKVVAVHSSRSVIVEGPDVEIRDFSRLQCVETQTFYEIGTIGMIPAEAYARGLRMVTLLPVDGPFDLLAGMMLRATRETTLAGGT
jgi:hypothetical protein